MGQFPVSLMCTNSKEIWLHMTFIFLKNIFNLKALKGHGLNKIPCHNISISFQLQSNLII